MKKIFKLMILTSLIISIIISFVASTNVAVSVFTEDDIGVFAELENGNLISYDGVEYYPLIYHGGIDYLANETQFVGGVIGEPKTSKHLGMIYETGIFAFKNDPDRNILIRKRPNSEWHRVYRKVSLPSFEYLVENCVKLEFVSGLGNMAEDVIHTHCQGGVTDENKIIEIINEIYSQKNPWEAGLYDMIKKPDGMLENCYRYGVLYGFFENEPNLVLKMEIDSFNDLAYSISIGSKSYVLPKEILENFEKSSCASN